MPFLKFLIGRLLSIPVTLLIITAVLYGIIMLASPEERALLYWPPNTSPFIPQEVLENRLNAIIEEHGLRDPYPVQYFRWLSRLARGDWGWSPVLSGDVLDALVARTAVTAELAFYSVLLLIPYGLIGGVVAGWRESSRTDNTFRLVAFVATSIPPFILGLMLLAVFYVGLRWFPPGRTSITELSFVTVTTFRHYTGLLTLDGLLNGRLDVTIDAFRHLALPVFALSLAHWATLARITRASIIEIKDQDYITAARARGLRARSITWRHALRNAMLPALTSSALSAASLITGVFVIEIIFNYKGLSDLMVSSMRDTPDASLALGFSVYSVFLVLPLMLVLDIMRVVVDPRLREGAQ